MNFTEFYEVRKYGAGGHESIGAFEIESDAVRRMDSVSAGESGSWRVVRVTEVTVASVARA